MKYRNSKQRQAILKILKKKNYHPTVDEIYSIIKKEFPRSSIATIYRNVEQLFQMNKILKLQIGSGPARYEGNLIKHYHARCKNCGKINDVWLEDEIGEQINHKVVFDDFTMTDYKIDFEGICASCNEINLKDQIN